MKKLLAIVISMTMIVAMMPVGVFAGMTENCTKENCSHQAAIGATHYDTLQEAVNAGGTVRLLKDVSNDNEGTGNPITIGNGKKVTLDLNGYAVTSYNCTSIINNGNLTIVDTSENKTGKVISTGTKANVAVSVGNNSKTIIDAGSFIGVEGAVITGNATGAEIKINNGNFSASDNAVIAGNGTIREGEENIIEINGGTFTGRIKTDGYVACGIYAPWKDKITVNGGTFNITNGAGVVARAGNVTINDGIFNMTGDMTGKVGDSRVGVPCSPIVFDSEASYPAMVNGSKISVLGGTFKSDKGVNISLIKKEEDTNERIQVTGGTFSDLSALDYLGADANVTIQLKDSVTLEKPININSGKIILDLSGKSIKVTKKSVTENEKPEYLRNGITVSGSADLTITGNGQITGPSDADCKDLDSKALIEVQGTDAKLTVLNGKISAGGVGDCGMYGIYVYDGGNVVLGNTEAGPIIETWFAAIGENNTTSPANITVNNGTYTENAKPADSDWWAYFCAPIYAASSGDITINGGTFNGYYGISTRYKKVEQNITISGGTFNGSKSAIFVDNEDGSETTEARKIVVKGGTFSTDPSAYVASGYYADKSGDAWTVKPVPYTPSTPVTDNVTNNTTDKNTTADLTPAVKDNKAETTVDAKTADKIVEKALENKSEEIIVDAAGNNTVASSEVGIPEKTVKELAEKTDANLVIKTDNGKVDLDKTALAAVAEQAGTTGTVRLVVETVKTDENICHVNLKLITSNGAVKDFRGGNVKVTINLTKELAAKELVCVYIDDNGIYTLVEGVLNADGTYTFTTGHFSEYAVMAKAEADKKIAEQLDTMIKDVNLKVRTSKTAKKNIKAVVSGDITALTDAGYTVKYKFYRSEKKASKYVSKGEKTADTYINTAGKKGTKYYYKAKAMVYSGDTLVGQTVLKQCKYGVRTWSK